MLSHHNMDPEASLSHGLMTHHFWLWGQNSGSKRPCGIKNWFGRGLLVVQNYSEFHPIWGIVLLLVFPQLSHSCKFMEGMWLPRLRSVDVSDVVLTLEIMEASFLICSSRAPLHKMPFQHFKFQIFCERRGVGAGAAPEGICSWMHLTKLRNEGKMSRFLMTGNMLGDKSVRWSTGTQTALKKDACYSPERRDSFPNHHMQVKQQRRLHKTKQTSREALPCGIKFSNTNGTMCTCLQCILAVPSNQRSG